MRSLLVGLVVTAACYAPSVAPGAPCADNGLCPEGQTCSAARICVGPGPMPDGGIDSGLDGTTIDDRDGDGIADTADNCPDDKNPDQANEDGDPYGDRCDPCPQFVDTAIADQDGDKIGDACDPSASVDVSWLFEGFHTGLPGWPGSNLWQADGDTAQVVAPGDPAPDSEYLVLPLTRQGRQTFDGYRTAAAIAITALGSGTEHEVGIEYYDSVAGRALECELADLGGRRILWLNDDFGLDMRVAFSWINGTTYVLRLVRHGTSYTCDVVGPGAPDPATATSNVVPHSGADTQIWVYGATARFGSVSVVGPPP